MLKGIKLRIYLNKEQESYAINILHTSRFVYNKCLSYRIDMYQNNNKSIYMKETSKYLTNLKKEDVLTLINRVY